MAKVWLVGGTSDSVILALSLIKAKIPLIITVTTPEAQFLYPQTPFLQIVIGKLSLFDIPDFIRKYQIKFIIDASHPFAVEVSQNIIHFVTEHDFPYLRFERPTIDSFLPQNVIHLNSFSSLMKGDYLLNQRVLLTIGYKNLPLFKHCHRHCTLFCRILPNLNSLQVALEAGFTPDRIIAFRPPLNLNLERELWLHWRINTVVTKASGKAGGEDIKINLAAELGVRLIIISRPLVKYPQLTNNPEKVVLLSRYFLEKMG